MSGPPGEAERFLLWVRSSQDTVEVKQAYVDTADDFVAEIVFRRIVYCRRPSRDGRSRLRVKREENPGLVKGLGRLVGRVQRQPRGSAWPPALGLPDLQRDDRHVVLRAARPGPSLDLTDHPPDGVRQRHP